MAPTLVFLIIYKIAENPFDYKLNDIPKHLQTKILETANAIADVAYYSKTKIQFPNKRKQVLLKSELLIDTDDGEGSRHFYLRYYKKHKKNEKEEMRQRAVPESSIQDAQHL